MEAVRPARRRWRRATRRCLQLQPWAAAIGYPPRPRFFDRTILRWLVPVKHADRRNLTTGVAQSYIRAPRGKNNADHGRPDDSRGRGACGRAALDDRKGPRSGRPSHCRRSCPRSRGATRYLPIRAVAFFHSLKASDLTDLALRHKREIWARLAGLEPWRLEAIEFTPGAMLDLPRLAADPLRRAERYREARDRYIASDSEILGGTPIIAGTRITVYSVLGRLSDGDTIEDIAHDYPEIPHEAFEAAALYAKAHPLRGRPSGRPWRNAA